MSSDSGAETVPRILGAAAAGSGRERWFVGDSHLCSTELVNRGSELVTDEPFLGWTPSQSKGILLSELGILTWKKSSRKENWCFQTQAEVMVCCRTQTFSRLSDKPAFHLPAGNGIIARWFHATNLNEYLKMKSRCVLVYVGFCLFSLRNVVLTDSENGSSFVLGAGSSVSLKCRKKRYFLMYTLLSG